MKCKYCDGTGTSDSCVNGTFVPCAACDGTGEEVPEDEVLYITDTNFDRITASPEKLAEWLAKHYDYCAYADCDNCPVNNEDGSCGNEGKTDYEIWLWWLKQEFKQ